MLKTAPLHSKFCIEVTCIVEDKPQDLLETLRSARNGFCFYTGKASFLHRPKTTFFASECTDMKTSMWRHWTSGEKKKECELGKMVKKGVMAEPLLRV